METVKKFVISVLCVMISFSSHATLFDKRWNKFAGKWESDRNTGYSIFTIEIERGDGEEVLMDFLFENDEPTLNYQYPVYAPLTSEGGECTDIFYGGPDLLTSEDLEDGNLNRYAAYRKSKEWSYVIQQIRSNVNGVILFEVETTSFPLTDDYSMKARVEHQLGLITTTAEYCIYRFVYAAIPKSNNQMDLLCLGLCQYYYGSDRNGDYGFVGGLFDANAIFNNRNRISLRKIN